MDAQRILMTTVENPFLSKAGQAKPKEGITSYQIT